MTIIYSDYAYVFDSVDFAIDVREYRKQLEMSQRQVATEVLGYAAGSIISKMEGADYDYEINVRDLIKLCNWMDKAPFHYFTMQTT